VWMRLSVAGPGLIRRIRSGLPLVASSDSSSRVLASW
jgi:hypothetical protein